MKNKIMVVMCSLLLTLPALSLAEGKKAPIPTVSADEDVTDNAESRPNRDLINNKENKKIRAKKLAEKKAAKEKKKTEKAKNKGKKQVKKKAPNPNESAYVNANDKARFKRTGDLFNDQANKKIGPRKSAEKNEAEAKKKTEEAQDKGEGQVKLKF